MQSGIARIAVGVALAGALLAPVAPAAADSGAVMHVAHGEGRIPCGEHLCQFRLSSHTIDGVVAGDLWMAGPEFEYHGGIGSFRRSGNTATVTGGGRADYEGEVSHVHFSA